MRRFRRAARSFNVAASVFATAASQSGFTLDAPQSHAADALSTGGDNLYLWGPAGRGKSWLMATYFAAVPTERKLRVHFHEFFRDLHSSIRVHGTVEAALSELLGDVDVVCFDEFHVHDPADGIFISRMLPVLLDRAARVIMTSNYPPASLLPNPLFHDAFVPAIELIERSLTIISIEGPTDYRTISHHNNGFAAGRWVSPGLPEQLAQLGLHPPSTQEHTTLRPAGHPIHAGRADGGSLWIDFHELCEKTTAPVDYLALAHDFQHWVINAVPDLRITGAEPAQRFANVIDVLYDRDVTPTFLATTGLETLAEGGSLPLDIERIKSRLTQLVRVKPRQGNALPAASKETGDYRGGRVELLSKRGLMTFPFEDAEAVGETEELRKQGAVYEAGEHGHEINRGHALGGTAGSIDGQ